MSSREHINRVRPGDSLAASDWNRIANAINFQGNNQTLPFTGRKSRDCLVFNETNKGLKPGDVAKITGFKTVFPSRAAALNLILSESIVLSVSWELREDDKNLIVAVDPIGAGRVGDAKFCGPGYFYAIISGYYESGRKYVSASNYSGLTTRSDPNDFEIVLSDPVSRVALLKSTTTIRPDLRLGEITGFRNGLFGSGMSGVGYLVSDDESGREFACRSPLSVDSYLLSGQKVLFFPTGEDFGLIVNASPR